MITHSELKRIAQTRLKDAKILLEKDRPEGAAYLCGYSVELALKAVICKKLNLKGIPGTSDEFKIITDTITNLKTHNLEKLLALTDKAVQQGIKTTLFAEWGEALNWDPEMRYAPIQSGLMRDEADRIIKASRKILKYLWEQL